MTRPRLALRGLWGKASRVKRVLSPGERVTVGRGDDCDVVIPHDTELSARHFTLSWDGTQAVVRDDDSRLGTAVGGARIEGPTPIGHRGWIRAGTTDLVVEIEMAPREVSPATRPVRDALAASASAGRLFGIVDAARGDRVVALLRSSMDPGRSLYEGLRGEILAEVAPHLVHFEPESCLLDALVCDGWAGGWALYVESDLDDRALRRHFRRFLVVDAEGIGPRTYFRFYDPVVFTAFWDMATSRQRAEISRGIAAFWVPDADGRLRRIAGADGASDERVAPTEPMES